MADDQTVANELPETTLDPKASRKKNGPRREVPGNFTYTTSPGKFREALEAMTRAERPPKFSSDFMSTVLGVSGGSARPIPPILKRAGFLATDSSPTDVYGRFKSEGTRSQAAYEGLRSAFPEIFKRNEFFDGANTTTQTVTIDGTPGFQTFTFNRTGLVSLTFQAVTTNEVQADNFVLNAAAGVPEPAGWALMLGGFGLMGAALRRRRAGLAA